MFGSIGGSEFLLIAVLALLLFGPRKLPQIGRSIGRALAEFRGATQEFKSSLEKEVRLEEIRGAQNGLTEAGREIADTVREVTRPVVARDAAGDAGTDVPPPADDARPSAGDADGETPSQS
jgi:Tat protein translocase TatB subunit